MARFTDEEIQSVSPPVLENVLLLVRVFAVIGGSTFIPSTDYLSKK